MPQTSLPIGGESVEDAIGFVVRACVATTFVLSAGWKLRHRAEFLAVLRSMRIARSPARVLGVLVPALEGGVAVLLVLPGEPGQLGGAAAAALIVVLSATLLRRDLSAGCGCWSGTRPERGPLLARNGVLLTLAIVAVFLAPSALSAELVAVLPIAVIFAVLIIEIPTILHYIVNAEGAPS
jgi:hypothetical protein